LKKLNTLRCLITGGLGFIGSNLARAAASRGVRVTVLDNLLDQCGGRREHLADLAGEIEVVEGDARDLRLLRRLVGETDAVFSLAGKTSHIESMLRPEEDLEHNVRAALNTLQAVCEVNRAVRVVFASTRQVYGVPQYLPVDEAHPLAPVDVNGIHKLAAERYHTLYTRVHGLWTACVRLTNTYGPRQLIRHDRQGFVGWFIRLVLEDRPLTVYGDGSQRRDFLYVDDAVEALLRIAVAELPPGAVLNLSGPDVSSLAELGRLMCDIGGGGHVEFVPFPEEKRAIDIGDFYADGSRLAQLLNWQPTVRLAEGLRRTFAYYRQHWRAYLDT